MGPGQQEGPICQASPWQRGPRGPALPSVSQPERLAFLPAPENRAEGQHRPCQGPVDLPTREPGQQLREARGPGPALHSWPAWASRW